MSGLTLAFVTSKSGMMSSQQSLAVISNNVAKANVDGYHRQSPLMSENMTIATTEGYFGTGVRMTSIYRHYDSALEESLQTATGNNSYRQLYSSSISQIEDLLSPKNTNPLSEQMTLYANAVQKVLTNPEDIPNRTALLSTSQNLADTMNQSYESLRKLRDSIATNDATGGGYISDRITTVNSLLAELPALNDDINRLESNLFLKETANDLRDQRDKLVNEISKYIKIDVTEEANRKYTISFTDPATSTTYTLVDGTAATPSPSPNTLSLSMTAPVAPAVHYTPQIVFNYADGVTPAVNVSLPQESGEIAALIDSRDYIATQMDNLASFATTFATEMNTIQAAGFDLYGNPPNPAGTNPSIFNVATTATSLGMSVVLTDPRAIAASGVENQFGNSANMQAMWNKLNQTGVMVATGDSLISYSNSYVRQISEDISSATTQAQTTAAAQTMFQNTIYQVSGVDMDQELTTMISVQRSYQAAAKMISTIDSMFETVLGLK